MFYLYLFWDYYGKFSIKKVSTDFKIYWNTLMKILYLKGYKWLLSQNQQELLFGDRRYDVLAKHTKPFLENIKENIRLQYHIFKNFYKQFSKKHFSTSNFFLILPKSIGVFITR